jgi:hypothetical protein
MLFTFGSSSVVPSLFPPAAAVKLNVERMLATALCTEHGEGGGESERPPLRATGSGRVAATALADHVSTGRASVRFRKGACMGIGIGIWNGGSFDGLRGRDG